MAVWVVLDYVTGPAATTADRIDIIRTSLTAAAGTSGLCALLLAFRRQHSTEVAAANSISDAAERRVTELYTKAADQLGSDKAPVRLAGLHALERLGQENPAHRQTIANVICAYLRMPYNPRVDAPRRRIGVYKASDYGSFRQAQSTEVIAQRQEREVRLTAQRILAQHLRPGDGKTEDAYWSGLKLDLTGATLVSLDFRDCTVLEVRFDDVNFVEGAIFTDAIFLDEARFDAASFKGEIHFNGTKFEGLTSFQGADFRGETLFVGTEFRHPSTFEDSRFDGRTVFFTAVFNHVVFNSSCFHGWTSFATAGFAGMCTFSDMESSGDFNFSARAPVDDKTANRINVWPEGWVLIGPRPGEESTFRSRSGVSYSGLWGSFERMGQVKNA